MQRSAYGDKGTPPPPPGADTEAQLTLLLTPSATHIFPPNAPELTTRRGGYRNRIARSI